MTFVTRAFTGHYRLWQIFWGGLLASVLLNFVFEFLVAALPEAEYPALIFMLLFHLWWIIAVWRSAFLCNSRVWTYLARVFCAAILIGLTAWAALIATGNHDMDMADIPVNASEQAVEAPVTETVSEAVLQQQALSDAAPVVEGNPVEQHCVQKLRDYAIANNADADVYVAQNQAWVAQCIQKVMAAQTGIQQ